MKFSKILLLILMDIAVCAILISTRQFYGLAGFFALILLSLISVVISLLGKYFNSGLKRYFSINIFLLPLLFYVSCFFGFGYEAHLRMSVKHFSKGKNIFRLSVYKELKTYDLSRVSDQDHNSFQTISTGKIVLKNDTSYLVDTDKYVKIKMHKNLLIGFPEAGDTLQLINQGFWDNL